MDRRAQEIAQFAGSGNYTLSAYTFDPLGQLLKVRRTTATGCSVPTDTIFGASASGCSVLSATTVDSATYDSAGNRAIPGAVYSSTGNRLLKWPGVYDTLTYDADGNLQTRKHGSVVDTLFWNAIGQLDSLHSGGQRLRYEYNGEGLLAKRSTNGTVDRYFLWDESGHLLAELNGSFGRIAEYVYAPGAELPFAMLTDSATTSYVTRYFQHDGLGSVIGATKNGALQQHTLYGAWGTVENQLVNTLADTNRIRWKGMLYEGDSTKLYYVQNRWYDPVIGRFTSEDPFGIEGGLNLYAFGGNDPMNSIDPDGTCDYFLSGQPATASPGEDKNFGDTGHKWCGCDNKTWTPFLVIPSLDCRSALNGGTRLSPVDVAGRTRYTPITDQGYKAQIKCENIIVNTTASTALDIVGIGELLEAYRGVKVAKELVSAHNRYRTMKKLTAAKAVLRTTYATGAAEGMAITPATENLAGDSHHVSSYIAALVPFGGTVMGFIDANKACFHPGQ